MVAESVGSGDGGEFHGSTIRGSSVANEERLNGLEHFFDGVIREIGHGRERLIDLGNVGTDFSLREANDEYDTQGQDSDDQFHG